MVTQTLNISTSPKREYLAKIYGRYWHGGRTHKSRILDESCLNCGYRRKVALRLLNRPPKRHPGPKSVYEPVL